VVAITASACAASHGGLPGAVERAIRRSRACVNPPDARVGGCALTRLEPVTYDDGDEEWTDLSAESIKWLDGKAKAKATKGNAKPATTSRGRVRVCANRVCYDCLQ
jgi:hypothetical protein